MKFKPNDVTRVINNPNTETLINHITNTRIYSNQMMMTEMFHKTHSKIDREIICYILKKFIPNIKINIIGTNSAHIIFEEEVKEGNYSN
jgi:abortive infection bacteriophage resistance protein